MKITHICAVDILGGAARAAYRLHLGLRALGQESTVFAGRRESSDSSVVGFRHEKDPLTRMRRGPRKWMLRRTRATIDSKLPPGASLFTDDRTEHGSQALAQLPPWDILHLHWFSGFLDHSDFFHRVPQNHSIVWTMHDMNPFTGGCHFDGGCGRFSHSCGACPQLNSTRADDFSYECWTRKRAAYSAVKPGVLHLVAPSRWLAGELRRSSLLGSYSVSVIPYGLDTDTFRPRDRRAARDVFNLGQEAKIILFLADWAGETRKGLALLAEALKELPDRQNVCLLILGRGKVDLPGDVPSVRLDYVRDDRVLSLIYSAADVFVLPALQDNLPNTILEALACGVPVVAFKVGGIPDIIRDGVEGRLVPPGDVAGLGAAIWSTLNDDASCQKMGANARRRAVQEYGLELQAHRYIELYKSLLTVQC